MNTKDTYASIAGCDRNKWNLHSLPPSPSPFFLLFFCVTRLQRDYSCACWLSTLAVVTPRRTTEQQKNLGLFVHLLRLVQLTYRRPGSGHDSGQLVRDYQHPRASRSHAPEAGEASLETDPRGTVRGRGTTFRTVSPVLLLFLFSLRLACTPFYLFSSSLCVTRLPRLLICFRLGT